MTIAATAIIIAACGALTMLMMSDSASGTQISRTEMMMVAGLLAVGDVTPNAPAERSKGESVAASCSASPRSCPRLNHALEVGVCKSAVPVNKRSIHSAER